MRALRRKTDASVIFLHLYSGFRTTVGGVEPLTWGIEPCLPLGHPMPTYGAGRRCRPPYGSSPYPLFSRQVRPLGQFIRQYNGGLPRSDVGRSPQIYPLLYLCNPARILFAFERFMTPSGTLFIKIGFLMASSSC